MLRFFFLFISSSHSWWIPSEQVINMINLYENRTNLNHNKPVAYPFHSGYSLRHYCEPSVSDFGTKCKMKPENIKNGSCVFVVGDCLPEFIHSIAPNIVGRYMVISTDSDVSVPDGQDDALAIRLQIFNTSSFFADEYRKGKLISFHASNTWWKNHLHVPRPTYLHCMPYGVNGEVSTYINAYRRNMIYFSQYGLAAKANQTLLLISFTQDKFKPDRKKIFHMLKRIPGHERWTNYTKRAMTTNDQFLDAVFQHKFVLVPHGRGLDSFRLAEVLLMGGIPVIRNSSIASCYDDSDNDVEVEMRETGKIASGQSKGILDSAIRTNVGQKKRLSRGSIPIVILNRWEDLTEERLNSEWRRITSFPRDSWDWSRVFMPHWLERMGFSPF